MKKILGIIFVYLIMVSQVFAKDFRFVQVSDVRYSKSAESDSLSKFVEEINKQKDINFVVFTGDNISHPDKEELKLFLSEAKKLNCPFYVVLGDKDVNKRKEMSKKEYVTSVKKQVRGYKFNTPNYIFEKKGLVFLIVDGSKDVIPSTVGYYKDDVTEWVDANLDLHKNKKVIILQHFPLVPPSEKELYCTYKADKYLEIINNHKNVKAVISGHFGVNKEQNIDGVSHISTAPLPEYRVIDILDYDTDDITIWSEVRNIE